MKNIYKALAGFQEEVPVIHESTKGYNYTYSNINSIFKVIKPLLKKHGLGFTQLLEGDSLKTIIFHVESSETIESSVNIPQNVKLNSMNHFQVIGSAITYYRRYSLSASLGLITDKDIDCKGEQVLSPERELNLCGTLNELKATYSSLSKSDQEKTLALKDELKAKLK